MEHAMADNNQVKTDKISVEDLLKRMADTSVPESAFQDYVVLDEARSGPFSPEVGLNPETVTGLDTAEGQAKSAWILNSLNKFSRSRRHKRFNDKIADSRYQGPIIVSEGDSWFQYPFQLEDIIDVLMQDYAVWSLDAAGDTLDNMMAEREYIKAIVEVEPAIFLISAGGNDMVGGGSLANHLRDFDPHLPPAGHLKESYGLIIEQSMQQYDKLFRSLESFNLQIICHGYDYALPAHGRWLGDPMQSKGIVDPAVQRAIAKTMVDTFNTHMTAVTKGFPNVTFLDNRGVVTDKRWHDELHPTNAGYAAVAARFKAAIAAAMARSAAAPAWRAGVRAKSAPTAEAAASGSAICRSGPVAGGRKGVSLHIGLNFVDKNHYAGWDGALNACQYDAEDMRDIAAGCGYSTNLLLSKSATRATVLGAIEQFARELGPGDMFFLSYSGHGGRLPDFNRDEADGMDETWCLYDGELIDDELYILWSLFREGVRVLVLSDSCHSGSVIKALPNGQRVEQRPVFDPACPATWARSMPNQVAARVFRQNRAFYTELGKSLANIESTVLTRELANPVACTVQLLSGCQDNQQSMDGDFNGAFTAQLLRTWDEGRFKGDYERFYKSIRMAMPSDQTPNRMVVGRPNSVYLSQRPFEI
jgi:lysophospholipase L1-like esterase